MEYKQKIGQYGENLAANYLRRKGYQILAQNIKDSYQEIDIIAKIKEKTVFVEVKTRTGNIFGSAEENLGYYKLKNIKKAVLNYIKKYHIYIESIRIDFIAIDINTGKKIAKVKHYKDII